jgi:hypothetical protein
MLVLLLDAAAIIAIVYLVNQGEQMDLMPAVLCGLGIGVGCFVIQLALVNVLGQFTLIPMALVAIAVIWMVAQIPLGRAAVAGVIFIVYKIAISLALATIFSTATG